MSGVWISDIMSDYQIGSKQGLRWKFPGGAWSEPTHIMPPATEESAAWQSRYDAGFRLEAHEIPEGLAIWDKKSFAKTGDLFTAKGMYAVKPALAEVLSSFDLGEGGLTPLTIYEGDLVTPVNSEYWLLHLGARKDTFLPEQSNKEGYRIRSGGIAKRSGPGFTEGVEYWEIASFIQDGDVAVSTSATVGADLWAEERVPKKLFLSGPLAKALFEAKLKKIDFRLKQCRVVGG